VWLASSEYHTHTLAFGPQRAGGGFCCYQNGREGSGRHFDLLALLHGGADDRRFAIADRELVAGARLQRQRLQVVEAGDDVVAQPARSFSTCLVSLVFRFFSSSVLFLRA